MGYELPLLALLAIATVLCIWLAVRFMRLRKQINFMLAAVENGDFAFRYPTQGRLGICSGINATLNKVILLLEQIADRQRQRDKYYEVMLSCLDTGIIVVDSNGLVVEHNKAACTILRREVITHIDQLADIDRQHFSIGTTPIVLHGRKLRIITVKDISHNLYQKEQESWEKITHVLTHEIMNSVTPITSLSETLAANCHDDDTIMRHGLATISRTGRGLMNFVEHYRQYANVPTPNPTLFYLKPFLEEMRSLALHQQQQGHNDTTTQTQEVSIGVKVQPADMLLHADESLTGRVVINILRNAIQAFDGNQPHPEINITARLGHDEETIIDITNNGPDMEPDTERQVFVPFFTTRPDGSGIGLPLSRRIMRTSGGDLQLITDRRHHLTTFRVIFP